MVSILGLSYRTPNLVVEDLGVRRSSAETSGPTRWKSHAAARCAATGEKMSRPWKVEETGAWIIQFWLVISRAESRPSRSMTGVMSPLSGRTKYWPFLDLTTMALREVPTPGSTTTRKTVPAG